VAALLEAVPIRALLSASAGHETSPVWRFTAASADGSGSLDDVLGQVQATTAGALARAATAKLSSSQKPQSTGAECREPR
jgi:hypothetical protein